MDHCMEVLCFMGSVLISTLRNRKMAGCEGSDEWVYTVCPACSWLLHRGIVFSTLWIRKMAVSVDSDEMAHHELFHLGLHCLHYTWLLRWSIACYAVSASFISTCYRKIASRVDLDGMACYGLFHLGLHGLHYSWLLHRSIVLHVVIASFSTMKQEDGQQCRFRWDG